MGYGDVKFTPNRDIEHFVRRYHGMEEHSLDLARQFCGKRFPAECTISAEGPDAVSIHQVAGHHGASRGSMGWIRPS
jgi:hypothetical protein